MDEYNSILKEKEHYEEPVASPDSHSNFGKYVFIDVILIMLILGISYVVYYQTVLSSEQIVVHDLESVLSNYQPCLKNLNVDSLLFSPRYTAEGTLQLLDREYNYGLIRDGAKFQLDLANQSDYYLLYTDGLKDFIQLSIDDGYYEMNRDYYLNLYQNFKNHFDIGKYKDRMIRTFYIKDYTPIVEINLQLNQEDINSLLGYSIFKEDTEVSFTFQNHALTDEVLQLKIVYHNKKQDVREVVSYQDGEIFYVNNDGVTRRFVLQWTQEDFILKIYQEDVLYSVLTGNRQEDLYQYHYQIIDQVYNLTLDVTGKDGNYLYHFTSNVEENGVNVKKEAKVSLRYQKGGTLASQLKKVISYSNLTDEEKQGLDDSIDRIFQPLREFIDQYK